MDTTTAVLVVIGVFALITIAVFLRYRQQGKAEIKGPFGISLKAKGRNESRGNKAGIVAKDITSHEGGMQAEETTGSGIEAESIDVKQDVILSSSNAQAQPFQQEQAAAFPTGLSAQALSAGGSITIQQFVGNQATLAEQLAFFVQQIGLINPRQDYAKSQFEAYCDAWKSLQSLRFAGDDLWERASSEKVLRFAELLRQTLAIVREGEIFFEDTDRNSLLRVLQTFAEFRVGKERLVKMRSRHDIERSIPEEHVALFIRRQIERNGQIKAEYENLLQNIRDSFRRRLSDQ